ncbi:MAG: sulfite exporter TauE/SafE family protein [Methanomicrobiaceae archaeon]|nr:sulfite exporter TauE/SafE family protein [Methanomicrobiaceae archaeon]MDD5418898.1 sulfite exporter TauE/SafE family protein [Methanomicrobiaceae archaeon]
MDPHLYLLILLAVGAIAGFSSGLIGLGGCFIMVPVQYWLLTAMGIDGTLAIRVAFGTGLAVAVPTAMSGAWGHHRRNAVLWKAAVPIGCVSVIGALLGGTIAAHLPGDVLKIAFGLVVLGAAVRMLVPIPESASAEPGRHLPYWIIAGLGVGVLSGAMGMGGGIVMVPVLVMLLGFSMHQAVGTSSACILFSSTGGAIAYIVNGLGVAGLPALSIGYIDLLQWAILAGATIPCAQIGVRAAHLLPPRELRLIFAGVMAAIGLAMLFVLQ